MVYSETILTLLEERGPGKTICPSDAARRAAGHNEWRGLMDAVRDAGRELAEDGRIQITQRGKVVDHRTAKGPIRYRLNVIDEGHRGSR